MPAPIAPFKRLLSNYKVDTSTGCWLWQGHKYSNGYGAIKKFGKMVLAHRFSYELHKGPIPKNLCVMHSCDTRNCINPEHLSLGTHQDNMSDAAAKGRMRSGPNHHNYGKPNPRPNQAIPVQVLGLRFSSMKEAERCFGLGAGTVAYWIKNCPTKAWKLKKNQRKEEPSEC